MDLLSAKLTRFFCICTPSRGGLGEVKVQGVTKPRQCVCCCLSAASYHARRQKTTAALPLPPQQRRARPPQCAAASLPPRRPGRTRIDMPPALHRSLSKPWLWARQLFSPIWPCGQKARVFLENLGILSHRNKNVKTHHTATGNGAKVLGKKALLGGIAGIRAILSI